MTNDDMITKLFLLPITLPVNMAKGAFDGAMRGAIDTLDELMGAEGPGHPAADAAAAEPGEPGLAAVPGEPEPAAAEAFVAAEAMAAAEAEALAAAEALAGARPAAEDEAPPEPEAPAAAEAPAEPFAGDETVFPSEVEPEEGLEPQAPEAVAEELGLPPEELTRGEAAELREREREAEATEDSPGAVVHVDEPWQGYGAMPAAAVVDRLRVSDEATKAVVLLYEEQHRARKSVLAAARGDD